jgi:hypothetical protein
MRFVSSFYFSCSPSVCSSGKKFVVWGEAPIRKLVSEAFHASKMGRTGDARELVKKALDLIDSTKSRAMPAASEKPE